MISRSQRKALNLLSTRKFSSALATADAGNTDYNMMSLWDYSEKQLAKTEETSAEDAAYLKQLRTASTERGAFSLAEQEGDHALVNKIKRKVNSIIEHELAQIDFKNQIDKERLNHDAYREIMTKSNFYFAVDENKAIANQDLASLKSPGNPLNKPNPIIPHEYVHVNDYVDLEGLTEDKMFEVYGYYAFLIDMHIAQVRPENIDAKSYVPRRFNQNNPTFQADTHINNRFFEFYHRWREPTRTWHSQTQEINFKDMLDKRPVASVYDHDKGDKHEVEWREDMKFPHVADRLGYPILREEPIERIFGIERAPAHPGYQLQPFVQTPSMDPDASLNFSLGETIYENNKVTEWTRFWKVMSTVTFGMVPGFYTFEIYAADGAPSLSWMADNWNWWQIPQQFQDGSGWGLEGYRYCDDHDYMNFQYTGKRGIARPVHTAYMLQVLILLQNMNLDYVSRMVYNKDKDLVFVYKPTGFWGEQEYVYEMHHMEQTVPFAVTAIRNMSMQKDDGILTIYDMHTRDNLKFYAEDKYWNLDVKEDFMANTRGLWKGNFDNKYNGSIFQVPHYADEEQALTQLKVDRELDAAIQKHGEAIIPTKYEEDWENRVDYELRKIAAQL